MKNKIETAVWWTSRNSSPDKKQPSLKDAPSYIRTSLRKFKIKRNKSSTSSSSGETKPEDSRKTYEKPRKESATKDFTIEPNESFFNASITEQSRKAPPLEASFNLQDVVRKTEQVESTAAKDRIRIAPKHRRLPTRLRGKAPEGVAKSQKPSIIGRPVSITGKSFDNNVISNSSQEFRRRSVTTSNSSHEIHESSKRSSVSFPSSQNGSQEIKRTSCNSRELRFSQGFNAQELKNSSLFNSQELKFSINEKEKSRESIPKTDSGEFIVNSKRTSTEEFKNSRNRLSGNISPKPVKPRRNFHPTKLTDSKSKSMGNLNDEKDEELSKLFANRKSYDCEKWKDDVFSAETKNTIQPENNENNEFQKSREKILRRRSTKESSESEGEGGLVAGLRARSGNETVFALTSPTTELKQENLFTQKKDKPLVVDSNVNETKNITSKNTIIYKPLPSPKKPKKYPVTPIHSRNNTSEQKASTMVVANNTIFAKNSELVKNVETVNFMESVKHTEPTKNTEPDEPMETDQNLPEQKPQEVQNTNTNKVISPRSRIPSLSKVVVRSTNTDELVKRESEQVKRESEHTSKIPGRQPSLKKVTTFDSMVASVRDSGRTVISSETKRDGSDNKRDADTKIPAYSRASLRKVPKRSDFMEESNKVEDQENKEVTDEKTNNSPATPTSNYGFYRTKSLGNKPSVPNKPKPKEKDFVFRSKDVALSQTMSMYEVQNENESKIPEWIKLAKQKQSDGNDEDTGPDEQKAIKSHKSESPDTLIIQSRPITSSRLAKSFTTKAEVKKDICMVCGRTAYMFEKCEVDQHTLHKTCAKCSVCARKLNVGAIFIHGEKVFCSQHK